MTKKATMAAPPAKAEQPSSAVQRHAQPTCARVEIPRWAVLAQAAQEAVKQAARKAAAEAQEAAAEARQAAAEAECAR